MARRMNPRTLSSDQRYFVARGATSRPVIGRILSILSPLLGIVPERCVGSDTCYLCYEWYLAGYEKLQPVTLEG